MDVVGYRDFFRILFLSIRDFRRYVSLMMTCKTLHDIGRTNMSEGAFESYTHIILRRNPCGTIKQLGYVGKGVRKYLLSSSEKYVKSLSVISRVGFRDYRMRKTLRFFSTRFVSLVVNGIVIQKVSPKFYEELDAFIREYRTQNLYRLIPQRQRVEIDRMVSLYLTE